VVDIWADWVASGDFSLNRSVVHRLRISLTRNVGIFGISDAGITVAVLLQNRAVGL
jgi:hypothetical protein